jgi:hypothetical protein
LGDGAIKVAPCKKWRIVKKHTPARDFSCLEREREREREESVGHQQQAPNKNLSRWV